MGQVQGHNVENLTLREKALIAFQRAIDKVILEHERLNMPLHIKRNGKVESVSAHELLAKHKLI